MAETKKDNKEWEEAIDKGSSLNRWDAELLGPAMENYRDHMGAAEQYMFLKNLPELFTKGKRLSDYRAAIDKRTEEEAGQAVWFDQTQFYKEVEETLKVQRKEEEKNEEKEREDKEKYETEMVSTLQKAGYHPMAVPSLLKHKYSTLDTFINWIFKKKLPKEVRKLGDDKKLEETLREIYDHYDKIDEINANIFLMKNNLSALEQKMVENIGTPAEKRIRNTITKQQNKIREAMTKRAQVMQLETNPREVLSAKLMKAVRNALKGESKEINKKFGNKIARLFRERQVLINQTTMLGKESPESITRKLDLQARIEQIDIRLDELKKELIKYKSKRPIFLFERLVGVQSIPMVYRFGQKSTLDFSYTK